MTRNPEADSGTSPSALSEGEKERIRHELDELMESAPFRSSQQCRSFLAYVITHTLHGDEGSLRERAIGNAVFGRPLDYDTGDDPVVRIRASEVRKRLAQYYQSLDRPPEVTVQIPSGSYRAAFFWDRDGTQAGEELARSEAEPRPDDTKDGTHLLVLSDREDKAASPVGVVPTREKTQLRLLGVVAVSLVALGLLGFLVVFFSHRADSQEKQLKSFWQPFLSSSKPVLISVGSNAVYRLSDEFADRYSHEHHLESNGMEFFPALPPDTALHASDIHPAADSFVALGDVAAVSQVVANLTRMHKNFQERFSNDISFAELRTNPTILVGGFNNAMTRELTRNYRFVFPSRNRIEDRQQPGKVWVLQASQDSHDTEDYAIISRILQQDDTAPLLSVAGLGQYGTLAATEFVFDPERLEVLQHTLPTDWQRHNLQILLHIKVNDFKPVSVAVVAVHSW
jgi:hypothetical protein